MFQKCNAALSFRFAFVKFLTRTQMLLQTFFLLLLVDTDVLFKKHNLFGTIYRLLCASFQS